MTLWNITVYLHFSSKCYKIMHIGGDFDASNAQAPKSRIRVDSATIETFENKNNKSEGKKKIPSL